MLSQRSDKYRCLNALYSLLVTRDISTVDHISSTSSLSHHQNLLVLSAIPTRLYQFPLPSDFRLKCS